MHVIQSVKLNESYSHLFLLHSAFKKNTSLSAWVDVIELLLYIPSAEIRELATV